MGTRCYNKFVADRASSIQEPKIYVWLPVPGHQLKKKLDSETGGEYSLGDGLLNGPI